MKLISPALIFVGTAVIKLRNNLKVCVFLIGFSPSLVFADECVVLLHGLARISNSMGELESKLSRAGFSVINVEYPSLKHGIETLSAEAVGQGIQDCLDKHSESIHFVTHSLGGILVRHYFEKQSLSKLGRVVMLGPPNQGTKLVDRLMGFPGFSLLGPTASRLGTRPDSILHKLGPVSYEVGVIAGRRNITPMGYFWLGRPNDSIVTVESTRVEGMSDHIILPVTHTFMMRNNKVIDHTINFLKFGRFIRNDKNN